MQKEPAGQLVAMAVSSQQSLTTLKASRQGDMQVDSSLSSVLLMMMMMITFRVRSLNERA